MMIMMIMNFEKKKEKTSQADSRRPPYRISRIFNFNLGFRSEASAYILQRMCAEQQTLLQEFSTFGIKYFSIQYFRYKIEKIF